MPGRSGAWGFITGVVLAGGLLLQAQAVANAEALLDAHARSDYRKYQDELTAARGSKRAELLAKLADLDYAAAHAGVAAGNFNGAEASLGLARDRADEAMTLLQEESRRGKTDGMQNVEMTLQNIAFGLRDMTHALPLRVRPFVEQTEDHFADLRGRLLDMMFAGKNREPAPAAGGGDR